MATKIAHQPSPERLYAWMLADPQHPQLIGEIIRQSNGDVGLQYAPSWLATGFALSDDMPLAAQTFTPVHRQGRCARCARRCAARPLGRKGHPLFVQTRRIGV
jgi:serine/threonine-protein kinase HipA